MDTIGTWFRGGFLGVLGIIALIYASSFYSSLIVPPTGQVFAVSPNTDSVMVRDTKRCDWFDRGTYYLVHESCIMKGEMPVLSMDEVMKTLNPYMIDIADAYKTDQDDFSYKPTTVFFDQSFIDTVAKQSDAISTSIDIDGYVQIPYTYLGWNQFQTWSVYASIRDTSMYGSCRKTNYDIAMNELDGRVVNPGELLNMNKIIARKPGYCTGGTNFLFYEGACGGSTQLFRNALLNPYIEVEKRYPHGKWYAGFYGSNIMGDDASMYERSKQLEVKNIGSKPIVFSTFVRESDGNTVLLSAYPEKSGLEVIVEKQQTGKRSAVLTNTILNEGGGLVKQFERESNYYGIDTSIDIPN